MQLRELRDHECASVAGGQNVYAMAGRRFLYGAAGGAGESVGESFWEWLTDPSYEAQTNSRFDPSASRVISDNGFVLMQENGLMWTDFDQNGQFENLYHDSDGDGIADWKWNEQEDRWERIWERAQFTAQTVEA
ncbi:MAG TPA: hypothetical protein VHM92_06605 [Allosphingosinicella sp.]|nr:hypothetical protein [Allosphingosinicella sp.]